MRAKRKVGFLKVTGYVVLSLAALVLIWIAYHHAMIAYEQSKYPAIGQYVDVKGQQMHVYTKGEGEKTIVLLSGLGTAAPALDFEPLVDELAKTTKVVVVETFGYGWSDRTSHDRTVENIVEEIRSALQQANITGPYILMPHSISGIYSMYYTNTYPDEVEAVIGIDALLPQATQYFHVPPMKLPKLFSVVGPTGLVRLAVALNPREYLPIAEDGLYTDENLKMTKVLSGWNSYNKSVLNEINETENNVSTTEAMSFPNNMPVLFFTPKEERVIDGGKNNVSFYETQLTQSPLSSIIVLEGDHYLHWTHYKEIARDVNQLIDAM